MNTVDKEHRKVLLSLLALLLGCGVANITEAKKIRDTAVESVKETIDVNNPSLDESPSSTSLF
jgi:hypothetical protein